MNRRDMLLGIGASALLARTSTAQENKDEKEVDFLFVQNAEKLSLKDGVLRLQTVSPATLYFSDRPERIVGYVPTAKFVDRWGEGTESFKADPPNAALSIEGAKEPKLLVVELKSPQLEDDTLVYNVKVLDGHEEMSGGQCSLFIDVIGRPLTPLSYAGVARRTTRRTARRVYRRGF